MGPACCPPHTRAHTHSHSCFLYSFFRKSSPSPETIPAVMCSNFRHESIYQWLHDLGGLSPQELSTQVLGRSLTEQVNTLKHFRRAGPDPSSSHRKLTDGHYQAHLPSSGRPPLMRWTHSYGGREKTTPDAAPSSTCLDSSHFACWVIPLSPQCFLPS